MFSWIYITFIISLLIISLIMTWYFYKSRKINRQLVQANQIKDRLFCIIGHDLSNPIGGVTQLLAIIEEEKEMSIDEIRPMISILRKQSDASLAILTSLLNWGKAQIKGTRVNPVNFLADRLINNNLQALQKSATDKSIEILNLVPADLTIFGDADHFDFIFRNLVSNAIKFSFPCGKIEISADLTSMDGQVVFSVKDYGKGVSKTQLQQFSESNMDIDFGTKGEKGTGIGLLFCKEFIKAGSGKIWIESEEGKGTTVSFYNCTKIYFKATSTRIGK